MVGSSAFQHACLDGFDRALQLDMLRNAALIRGEPKWLESLRERGFFSLEGASAVWTDIFWHDIGRSQTVLESVQVLASTLISVVPPAKTTKLMVDPVSGDPLPKVLRNPDVGGFSSAHREHLGTIVEAFLHEASGGGAPGKPKLGEELTNTAAFLLAGACALGDVASATAIVRSFPDTVRTRLLGMEALGQDFEFGAVEVTPVAFAVARNQLEVLRAISKIRSGFDPFEPIMWMADKGAGSPGGDSPPRRSALNFFQSRIKGIGPAVLAMPSTAEFFLKAYVELDPASVAARYATPLLRKILSDMFDDSGSYPLAGPIIRSGVARCFGNELFDRAVMSGSMEMLRGMRPGLHWPDHTGSEFPVILAATAARNELPEGAAVELARWCVEDGYRDLLIQEQSTPDDKLCEDITSVARRLAMAGATDVLLYLFELGQDPGYVGADTVSLARAAELHGHVGTGAAIRSILARREALSCMDDDEMSQPSVAGRRP